MSLHIAKLIKNPLILASAALLIQINAASAADSAGDTQQQVRDLLTGTTTAHSAPQTGPREGNATSTAVDSQEFVKQLLLGATASPVRDAGTLEHAEVAGTPGKTESQQRPSGHGDIQAAMRKLLLGQPHASDAS